MTLLRLTRRLLTMALAALLVGLVALSLFARQETTFVIRGRSMEPALPIGSLTSLRQVAASEVQPGDIVTVRADNGVVITHRVVRLVESGGEQYLELKGDANDHPDAALVPVRMVVGEVGFYVPLAGFVVALLATPGGFLSVVCLFGSGLLVIALLGEIEAGRRRRIDDAAGMPDAVPS